MKNKRIIKFISFVLAILILMPAISISAYAQEESGSSMDCVMPVWIVPIIIAISPLIFCIEMFNSFRTGDFSIINDIPELFSDLWSMVFG